MVTVEDKPRGWTFPADRHLQSVNSQGGIKAAGKGIANNILRTWVFDNGGIKPDFIGRDVGNVTHPDGIGLGYAELAV